MASAMFASTATASTSNACEAPACCVYNQPHRYRRSDRRSCSQLHGLVTTQAFSWESFAFWRGVEEGPPTPSSKFTSADRKRIKSQGPTMDDLTVTRTITKPGGVTNTKQVLKFVPPSVLGDVYASAPIEPVWKELPTMSLMEYHHGLRQRNWTSIHFDKTVEPWHTEIWSDRGRWLKPSFEGYRAVVTRADGSKAWVNMPLPGCETDVKEHTTGGTMGAMIKQKRAYPPAYSHEVIGYNQVFEQLFQAYEEQVPEGTIMEMIEAPEHTIDRSRLEGRYSCPADKFLTVSFESTAQPFSIRSQVGDVETTYRDLAALSFLFVAVIFSILRTTKGEPSDLQEAVEFAQSKGRARKDGTTDVTLADVAGLDAIKDQFVEVVGFLKDPQQYAITGCKPPKGILLEGPPGTGKTLIAKAIAGEAQVGFYQMAGSEFVEAIVGVGAARVRDLFKRAAAYETPCIIFVDEIDALGIRRASNGVKTNEEREQTLNQLLTEMDGFNPSAGIVFVAATNRADLLDPALLRVGRFDRKIQLPRPDAAAREQILQLHAKNHTLDESIDLAQLAYDLPGLVGADLMNVLNEGALAAVRDGESAINNDHLTIAKDRILQGVKKPMLSTASKLGSQLMYALAVHEGGRALMATDIRAKTGLVEPVDKVSILRRGDNCTRTTLRRSADEEYLMITKSRMIQKMRMQLAGHASECAMGLDISTYSCKDFTMAKVLAQRMVENYGMSEIGVTTYAIPTIYKDVYAEGKANVTDLFEQQLLAEANTESQFQPHEAMLTKLESTHQKVVSDLYDDVLSRLHEMKPALKEIADTLYKQSEMTGSEVIAIYERHVKN